MQNLTINYYANLSNILYIDNTNQLIQPIKRIKLIRYIQLYN
jgi:hypothetical protein